MCAHNMLSSKGRNLKSHMSILPPTTPSGILASAAVCLSPKDALRVLRCCKVLQQMVPSCLSSSASWLWVTKNLDLVSLGQLRAKDLDLCQCLQATTVSNFSIEYDNPCCGSTVVIDAEG
eukprot:1041753-Amphidinium_carterae.1